MAFIVNKITDSVTNATGSIIGRENLTKLSNSLNKTIYSESKYRQFVKHGNVIQLVSRNSLRSLQIVRSIHNPTQLIIVGDGQIGQSFTNAHFTILINNRNQHIAFQNANNYIGLSHNRVLGILTIDDPKLLSYKTKKNLISNIEFRLHEIFGSEEFFCLESTYSPGNYLSVAADNTVSFVKNKTDKSAHFQLHLVNNASPVQVLPPQAGAVAGAPVASGYRIPANASAPLYMSEEYSKEEEANQSDNSSSIITETTPVPSNVPLNEPPPVYNTLYPQLPK